MITDCGVIVILRITEGICPTMISDCRIFRYVNLKTQITIYENERIMYQPGIRKTYTQVTLALISNVHRF